MILELDSTVITPLFIFKTMKDLSGVTCMEEMPTFEIRRICNSTGVNVIVYVKASVNHGAIMAGGALTNEYAPDISAKLAAQSLLANIDHAAAVRGLTLKWTKKSENSLSSHVDTTVKFIDYVTSVLLDMLTYPNVKGNVTSAFDPAARERAISIDLNIPKMGRVVLRCPPGKPDDKHPFTMVLSGLLYSVAVYPACSVFRNQDWEACTDIPADQFDKYHLGQQITQALFQVMPFMLNGDLNIARTNVLAPHIVGDILLWQDKTTSMELETSAIQSHNIRSIAFDNGIKAAVLTAISKQESAGFAGKPKAAPKKSAAKK